MRVAVISLVVTIFAMPILVELAVLMSIAFDRTAEGNFHRASDGQFLLATFVYLPAMSLLGVMIFPLQLLLALLLTTVTGAYLGGWPGINERHPESWKWCCAGAVIGFITILAMQLPMVGSLPINRGLVYPGIATGVLCMLIWRWWMRRWVARARRQATMTEQQLLSTQES